MKRLELAVHPPVVFIATGTLMFLAHRWLPVATIELPHRKVTCAALFLASAAIALTALVQFARERTTIDPKRPEAASRLVTTGAFRWTRNPIYLALLIWLLAWGLSQGNLVSLALIVVFPLWITRFQIIPEERALAAKFGDKFERYRRRTRRWI